MRLVIFDCIWSGDGGEEEDDAPLCSALLMSLSAELRALWSDELMAPDDTIELSSLWSVVNGDCVW